MGRIRVLGVDLGTTALKAVLSDGVRVLDSASAPVPTRRPKPLWSEQFPADWWSALVTACAALSRKHPRDWREVSAVGLSGHMHGAVLLKDGKPLRPCILHNDGRAADEARQLNEMLPAHAAIAGVRAMAGFTAPKLLWLRHNEPEVLDAAEVVLSPKDYLRFRLTGAFATDPVDASGMWLLEVAKRQWCLEIVAATGLSPRQLPPIHEGNAVAGHLTRAAAKALHLPSSVTVVTGTGDAAANTLGLGLVEEGDGVISLGTAAQIFVSKRAHVPAPAQNIHAFAHALPGLWFQMAAMLNGAAPLAWAADLFAPGEKITTLLKQVERGMTAPSRLLYLPYLTGERTPNDDPAMRAAFMGLDAGTTRADMLRATLEGIAFSLADSYEVLTRTGTVPHILYAVGGGLKSALWAKMIASALGRGISVIPASETGGALGVARLARQALSGEPDADVYTKPAESRLIEPDPDWQAHFTARLPAYRALYQALRPIR